VADGPDLVALDALTVDVVTDDVSDNYVSKTLFAVSEFANVVRAGARRLAGEALLCVNLGFSCRLKSEVGGVRHAMLFDTGPEGPIFLRNCGNLGISLSGIECIALSQGHWDYMAALPAALAAIRARRSAAAGRAQRLPSAASRGRGVMQRGHW
jgi:7,8-dihydropterin-6-yl-methyl-4-(beta-D-ribofuranosyl)aminobenzene 5'-phosphate synthase